MPRKKASRTARAQKEKARLVRFMKNPKPHAYNPSGLGNCVDCSRVQGDAIHIRPHKYNRNFDSKLARCMCGYREPHQIHIKDDL